MERFEDKAIDGGTMYGYGLSLVGSREMVKSLVGSRTGVA